MEVATGGLVTDVVRGGFTSWAGHGAFTRLVGYLF